MQIHNLIQSSPEWLAHRRDHRNASDAPAMMGCSPYKTRADLLRETHTGLAADIDIATRMRFDNGHRAEALARPLAEEFIGAELYPVTGSKGKLSASFDGLTLDETTGFEHKALNDALREAFRDMLTIAPDSREHGSGRCLPLYHRVQMEQQLLISGAERVLFMASKWDAEGNLIEEQHCWYFPDLKLRQQIVDGWAQFERDLAAYVLPESVEPKPVGKAPDLLPALRIEVTGEVTASNLAEFKATALGAIRSVNRVLKTDQDFADAEKAVKWCAEVESRIAAAKEHALSQTASIDMLFKALEEISAEAREARLEVNKLVTRRKTEVKEEAVAKARRALDNHVADLNAELAPMRIKPVVADFAGAIKGMRSVQSMQDALDQVLTAGIIEAEASARVIRANLATFKAAGAGFEFLFADLGQLVQKAADDFGAVLQSRIAAHQAAEAERERQRKVAEDARVQAEAQRLAAQQAEDARVAALAEQRRQDAAAEAVRVAAQAPAAPPQLQPVLSDKVVADANARAFVAHVERVGSEPATLKLGTVCDRLGFTMTANFVSESLKVAPARVEGSSRLYRESDFHRICVALQQHVEQVRMAQRQGLAA